MLLIIEKKTDWLLLEKDHSFDKIINVGIEKEIQNKFKYEEEGSKIENKFVIIFNFFLLFYYQLILILNLILSKILRLLLVNW